MPTLDAESLAFSVGEPKLGLQRPAYGNIGKEQARFPMQITAAVSILRDLVDALASAGDVVKSFTDGIAYLVSTGVGGYDRAKARLTYNELLDISARTSLVASGQMLLAESLEDYVRMVKNYQKNYTDPGYTAGWPRSARLELKDAYARAFRESSWRKLTQDMTTIFEQVLVISKQVEENRSDFVLKPAYQKLLTTLGARKSLLKKLIDLPPPQTPAELALIKRAARKYDILIEELGELRHQMDLYLEDYHDNQPTSPQ